MFLKWFAYGVIGLVVGCSVWLGSLVDQKAKPSLNYRLVAESGAHPLRIRALHAPAEAASAVQRPVQTQVRFETQ
ncbi:hypothetical protein [Paucibacter sp. Y2R2-4]|uniref:hypothetical protein n=1 Tax=Paucibacter sp. Y2R2-4 TaxID=2893553 RepID=UPI0021E3B658|nr:hypothetical protein [Paucibacter sp. Y2R2-4]MCV2350617.1 hypothetical protein [Paucibacter sp. Y2R2-4]